MRGDHGVRARRGAVMVLLVGAALLAPGWTPAPGAAAAPPGGGTTTPVLSVRRVAGWVDQSIAEARLGAALTAILADPGLDGAAGQSCVLVRQGGHTLFQLDPGREVIPASNLKLLTATALIDRLGPSRRFVTEVVGPAPVRGVVHGNLYLVGSGDPLLYTSGYAAALGQTHFTSLDALAHAVMGVGVTTVTGSVIGDEARYDQMRTVPSWSPVYSTEGDVGPLSALEVNDGASPGPLTSPPAKNLSKPTTTSSAASLKAAASTDPAVLGALTFEKTLRSDGVHVSGTPAAGAPPVGDPVLATIASAPLAQEVDAMLTVSDDTAAELFTKELGLDVSGHGTTTAGVAAIRADLTNDGLPTAQLVQVDGSGLSRDDRVTCQLIVDDLMRVGLSSVVGRGLPVAGQTGTLAGRMVGTPAAGRLRAKTGTLNNVTSLSGFVTAPRGARPVDGTTFGQALVFASILNGVPTISFGEQIEDQIGVALAEFPHAPPVSALGPQR